MSTVRLFFFEERKRSNQGIVRQYLVQTSTRVVDSTLEWNFSTAAKYDVRLDDFPGA